MQSISGFLLENAYLGIKIVVVLHYDWRCCLSLLQYVSALSIGVPSNRLCLCHVLELHDILMILP